MLFTGQGVPLVALHSNVGWRRETADVERVDKSRAEFVTKTFLRRIGVRRHGLRKQAQDKGQNNSGLKA